MVANLESQEIDPVGGQEIPAPEPAPSGFTHLRRELVRDRRSLTAFTVLVVIGLIAIFGPPLLSLEPNKQNLSAILEGPSGEHWLGTDDVGRDVFARLIVGTRMSAMASVIAVAVGLGIGLPIGLICGWFEGWVDAIVMRFVDAVLAFPGLVLAIAVTGIIGPGVSTAMIAVGIVFSPVFARLARAQVLTVKQRLFVDASRAFGAKSGRLLIRHVLPNTVQPIIVQCSLYLAAALIAEASLSFLGLGVQPPDASWGSMLGRAYRRMSEAPVQVFAPGIAIMITAWAFNTLGDGLRRILDPKQAPR